MHTASKYDSSNSWYKLHCACGWLLLISQCSAADLWQAPGLRAQSWRSTPVRTRAKKVSTSRDGRKGGGETRERGGGRADHDLAAVVRVPRDAPHALPERVGGIV
eukprot:2367968-Rhodomonas_salina.2